MSLDWARPTSALLVYVFFVVVSCGGSTAGAPHAAKILDCRGPDETLPGAPSPSPGISYPTLTVGNELRDFRLFRPSTLDPAKPIPLVIVMPPPSADADLLEDIIHFDSQALAGGFLSASPNGCGTSWSYSPGPANVADETFIRKMIENIKKQVRVGNIYAVSVSGGSRILYRLGCDLADEISAVADVAGTMILKDDCQPSRPVSILEIHGTLDDASPWDGGGPNGSYPVVAVNERWRTLDNCTGAPVVTQAGITVTSTWTNCKSNVVVRLDKVVGGKHTWFGSGDSDAVPGEPNANAVIWSFFSGLPAGA